MSSARHDLAFGDFVLHFGRRELKRRGARVHLSPKAFRLLELLVNAAPDAVSKEQLYNAIWPDVTVEEANLPNLVKELRKALDDDSRNPRVVRTIYGFGYAFEGLPTRIDRSTSIANFFVEWSGRQHRLREGENVLGRDIGNDVCVDSAGVSRRHAVIHVEGSQASIADLDSKNGTFVNGQRITSHREIRDSDEIRLGSAMLHLHSVSSAETTLTEGPKS